MVFFLTGGSRGLGAGLVRDLVHAGHDVAFTYRQGQAQAERLVEALREACPDRKCAAFALDVRSSAAVDEVGDAVLEAFGTVDVVINNAAIARDDLAVRMSDEDWKEVIDTNLSGSFYVARKFLPTFLSARRGRFLFVSSIAQRGISGQANYAASKGGLVGLSATLAKEYGRRGITSNVLVLGVYASGIAEASLGPEFTDFAQRFTPTGRRGQAEDLTGLVLMLASDAAGFITGQEIGVNGGLEWGP